MSTALQPLIDLEQKDPGDLLGGIRELLWILEQPAESDEGELKAGLRNVAARLMEKVKGPDSSEFADELVKFGAYASPGEALSLYRRAAGILEGKPKVDGVRYRMALGLAKLLGGEHSDEAVALLKAILKVVGK